ncbi:Trafficking protein particle complex subunit 1 [Chytridiales sp. JEL 0842]|nr:Trafficking protein particle complex subunit 1 [Chytridiales sp. JEL 0842]
MIYSLYIFDRHCDCVFFSSWKNAHAAAVASTSGGSPNNPSLPQSTAQDANSSAPGGMVGAAAGGATSSSGEMAQEEEAKLVYGVVYSIRNIVNKLLAGKPGADGFSSYKTNTYKLHYYETPSGMKLVMNTDPNCETMQEVLRQIYANIYVEYVIKNPLATLRGPVKNELFKTSLNNYLQSLPQFTA